MVIRKMTYTIILLLIFLTKKETSYGNLVVSFKRYTQSYGNFPYRYYRILPLGNACFTKTRVSNIDLLMTLYNTYDIFNPIKLVNFINVPIKYVVFFFTFARNVFSNVYSNVNIISVINIIFLPILNVLSVLIPQYVWIWAKYKRYKALLKINFETGYYTVGSVPTEISYNGREIKTQKDINEVLPPPDKIYMESICTICLCQLKNNINKKVETYVSRLNCKHYFHTGCINANLNSGSNKCPNCLSVIHYNYTKKKRENEFMFFDVRGITDKRVTDLFCFCNIFFSYAGYVDVTLGTDNISNILNSSSAKHIYWSCEIILMRVGAQAILLGGNIWHLNPFIGFCGIFVTLFNIINVSIIPTYMRNANKIYPAKMLLDVCVTLTFYRKNIYDYYK